MQCPHCNTKITRPIKQRPRGTRYIIMFDCHRCGRTVGIEGVSGVTPPKVMK